MATFANTMGIKVIRADAEERFLGNLVGVDDPEDKRKKLLAILLSKFSMKKLRSWIMLSG
ncbi:MAG: hypothetical protein CM1200mP40_12360 [Gammaproteobacteria bacterium]|nr:MAG: hypothetical protein CM1200mP40_12360 [Gammaproteobacteria bacterium]